MEVRRPPTAEKRSTGMLTKPKVIVPDQKDRTAAPCRWRCSGNAPLLDAGKALTELVGEVAADPFPGRRCQLHLPAVGLRFDQLAHTLAVLVLPQGGVKVARDLLDQALGELQLLIVYGSKLHLRCLEDLLGSAQGDHHQVALQRRERAEVVLSAHDPARDAEDLALPECLREGEVALIVVSVRAEVVGPLVPLLAEK